MTAGEPFPSAFSPSFHQQHVVARRLLAYGTHGARLVIAKLLAVDMLRR